MRRSLLIAFFLAFNLVCWNQSITSSRFSGLKDNLTPELLTAIDEAEADSTVVQILLDIGYELEFVLPDSAIAVYDLATEIGESCGYHIGKGRALMYRGIVLSDKGMYDASLESYGRALEVFKEINFKDGIAACYINIGVVYNYNSELEESVDFYLQGIEIYERLDMKAKLVYSYGNVGGILMKLKSYDRAKVYFDLSLQYANELDEPSLQSDALNNMAFVELELGDTIRALENYHAALKLSDENDFTYLQYLINSNLSDIYNRMGQGKVALEYAIKGYAYAEVYGNPYDLTHATKVIGSRYLEIMEYDSAGKYFDQMLQLSLMMESEEFMSEAYEFLAELNAALGNYTEAYQLQLKHQQFSDSLFMKEQRQELNELEVRFQSEKKDRQIAEQDLVIEKGRNRQMLAYGGAMVLSVVLLFVFIYFRQKQRLKDQEIVTIVKEKELASVKSMMAGEEQERSRIARELHDGLSGLLASVKLQFNSLKKNVSEEPDKYDKALSSLDNASNEVRRIAHNMMPEMLMKFGLVEALSDFFKTINSTGTLSIDFQHYGMEERLAQSTELVLYRVVQELINNIIKHSKASEAIVQFNRNDDVLMITVEDDGQGFDPSKEKSKSGLGMKNLQNRINYLKGDLNIESSEGMGTSVYIEIDLHRSKNS